jgi:hypothetical protein
MQDTCKITGPENCGDVISWEGQSYEAAKDGSFDVPIAAAAALAAHGFVVVAQKKERPDDKRPAK